MPFEFYAPLRDHTPSYDLDSLDSLWNSKITLPKERPAPSSKVRFS